jgi:hypothetical protein
MHSMGGVERMLMWAAVLIVMGLIMLAVAHV